jgi:tetratricopeptide (TPR) repeat protein
MKKYAVIIILCFIIVGASVYYFSTKQDSDEEIASDHITKAEEYLVDKQYSNALEQYKLAINSDPTNTDAYLEAAEIYELKSKDSDAIELLKNGESVVNDPDKLQHKIGQLLLKSKDLENAIKYLEKANSSNSNNWENSIDLVKAYSYYEGKQEKSISILEKTNVDEGEGQVLRNYYLALLNIEDVDKSIDYLSDLTNISDTQLKEQIENFTKILNRIKEDPDEVIQNDTYVAYELIRAELYPYALTLLENVISENDEYYAAYMYQGICQIKMEEYEEAAKSLSLATSVDPDQLQPWVFLAQAYVYQNNPNEAIKAYEEALNIDKNDEEVRLDYARSLVKFELFQQARHQFQELIKLDTEDKFEYMIELANIDLDQLEDYEEGLSLTKDVIENWEGFQSSQTSFRARALDTLGWAFQKNEQKDEALKYLRQALETDQYLASAYYHIGVIYADIENLADATANLERAIDLDTEGNVSASATQVIENLKNESSNSNN